MDMIVAVSVLIAARDAFGASPTLQLDGWRLALLFADAGVDRAVEVVFL